MNELNNQQNQIDPQVVNPNGVSSVAEQNVVNNNLGDNASIPKVPRVPKINPKTVLIILGVFVFLILGIVGIKALLSRANQNKQFKIVWWSLEEDEAAVKPLIDAYENQNPNVTIEFVKEDTTDYRERLFSALNSGKGPDIFEYHNSWVPMFRGNLQPIAKDFSSIFYQVVSDDLKTSKGFLGVPLEYDGIALFINQDILRTYGLNAPKTWDDFRSLAQSLTLRDQNGAIRQSGASMGVTSNVDYWPDIFALLSLENGVDLTQPTSPAGLATFTFYTNFTRIDKTWDDTLPNSTTYFNQGSLAMYFGKYRDAAGFTKNTNLHFQVVSVPQLPQSPSFSYASFWVNGVSKTSPNSDAAWKFLEFMISQDSLRKLYKNEVDARGYGNLYPRVDMQQELLTDPIAGPFIFQAKFAKSWYLNDKTFDGLTGINSQLAAPFSAEIGVYGTSLGTTESNKSLQSAVSQVLASYGLVAAPIASP